MKILNVFLLCLVLAQINLLFGQETFSKRMHLGYNAATFSSIEVTDSCYYVSGIVADTVSPYNTGVFFARFALNGDLLFRKTLVDSTKTYEAWENTLTPLEDGNFILSAFSSYEKGLIIKYSPEGDTLYTKSYKSPYFQENPWFVAKDLVVLADGGFALASIINDGVLGADIYLLRTDSLGNILWDQIYESFQTELVHSLITTSDGGFLIGAGAEEGGYLIKTDNLGEIEWEYTIPSSESINAFSDLHQLADGSVIIAASFHVDIGQGVLAPNNVLLKLNTNQELLWTRTFRDSFPSMNTKLKKLLPLPDNEHVLAAGGGYGIVNEEWQKLGKLIKASYDGDSIWTRYYHYVESYNARNLLFDLEATSDGGFIMCGQAVDTQTIPDEYPRQQGWLLKVDEHGCLVPGCHLISGTIEMDSDISFEVKVYPNPASDYLNVYFYHPSMKGEAKFDLLDASGRVVESFESGFGDVTHMLRVDDVVAGVYWLTCRVGAEVLSREVVIGK